MANILSMEKKIAVIRALAEGSSIRSIERIMGVHRDTIMRLGVKVGKGCTALMDAKMRDLPCNRLVVEVLCSPGIQHSIEPMHGRTIPAIRRIHGVTSPYFARTRLSRHWMQ